MSRGDQEPTEEFPALRIVQIDARELDETLIALLRSKFDEIAINIFQGNTNWLISYQQQLHDCIQLLYFAPQIFTGQSPGQRLMNVRFGKFSILKGVINFVSCQIFPAIAKMIKSHLPSSTAHTWAEKIELNCHLLDFTYFIYFLSNGGPIRLSEKVVGLEAMYEQKPKLGNINFAGLNRELLGHSFAQLLILILPIYNILKERICGKQNWLTGEWTLADRLSNILFRRRILDQKMSFRSHVLANNPVQCAECGQTAYSAVRARPKRRTSNHSDSEWSIYCQFCLNQLNSSESEFDWEPIRFGNRKRTENDILKMN